MVLVEIFGSHVFLIFLPPSAAKSRSRRMLMASQRRRYLSCSLFYSLCSAFLFLVCICDIGHEAETCHQAEAKLISSCTTTGFPAFAFRGSGELILSLYP